MRKNHQCYKISWAALTNAYANPSKVEIIRSSDLGVAGTLTPGNGFLINQDGGQDFNIFTIATDWTAGGGALLSLAPYARNKQQAATAFFPMTEGPLTAGVVLETQLEITTALAQRVSKPYAIYECALLIKAKSDVNGGSLIAYLNIGN